jgi:DNA-binding transcriptional LysR family regulator
VLLARSASFAAAARALSLTASAVSHSIRSFEEDTGAQLFERCGHRAILTTAGQRLLPWAERILADMSAAREELRQALTWGRGELRVSAPASICRFVLPPALCEFRESFPDAAISVHATDSPAARQHAIEGAADLAIAVDEPDAAELEACPLFSDRLHLFVSPHHPWANRPRGSAWRPEDGRFILYSLSSVSGGRIMSRLELSGVRRSQIMEIGSQEAILEMTRIGIGAAVLPEWIARKDESRGLIRRIPGVPPVLERKWSAAWRRGRELPVTTRVMLGLITDVCRDLACAFQTGAAGKAGD